MCALSLFGYTFLRKQTRICDGGKSIVARKIHWHFLCDLCATVKRLAWHMQNHLLLMLFSFILFYACPSSLSLCFLSLYLDLFDRKKVVFFELTEWAETKTKHWAVSTFKVNLLVVTATLHSQCMFGLWVTFHEMRLKWIGIKWIDWWFAYH